MTRGFTHACILVSVFHPHGPLKTVDGHGVSPTFACGWTRCFTHGGIGVSPTLRFCKALPSKAFRRFLDPVTRARAIFNFINSLTSPWLSRCGKLTAASGLKAGEPRRGSPTASRRLPLPLVSPPGGADRPPRTPAPCPTTPTAQHLAQQNPVFQDAKAVSGLRRTYPAFMPGAGLIAAKQPSPSGATPPIPPQRPETSLEGV